MLLKSENPIPLFDQSVAKQVGLDLLNMRTCFSISLTITALDSSKSWLSVSSQWNGVPGLSNRRNGSMRSVIANAYDTRLMSPNQECMSVRLAGVGKLWMALRYFLHGHTLSGVISNPENSAVSALSTNLSGFKMMPWSPQRSNQLTAWVKLSLRLSDQSRVLSTHLVLLGTWEKISSNLIP